MGVQAFQLGLDPWSRCRPRKWKQKVQDASAAARTARLTELVNTVVGYRMVAQGGMLHTSRVSQAQGRWGPGQSWCQPLVPGSTTGGLGLAVWRVLLRWWPGGSQGPLRPSAGRLVRRPLSGPGVEETGTHVVLDCPQHQHVRATACAKATNAVGIIGTPAEQGWRALNQLGWWVRRPTC